MTEIARLSPYMLSKYPDPEALMVADPKGQYTFADTADALKLENTMLKQRLAQMGEVEIDLHAKIIQLESEARGPEPYATWNEAAVAERMKRMDVNKRVRELEVREAQALPLIQRWLEVDTKHDWSGFQKQVEEYLGVNQPEPIPHRDNIGRP